MFEQRHAPAWLKKSALLRKPDSRGAPVNQRYFLRGRSMMLIQ